MIVTQAYNHPIALNPRHGRPVTEVLIPRGIGLAALLAVIVQSLTSLLSHGSPLVPALPLPQGQLEMFPPKRLRGIRAGFLPDIRCRLNR